MHIVEGIWNVWFILHVRLRRIASHTISIEAWKDFTSLFSHQVFIDKSNPWKSYTKDTLVWPSLAWHATCTFRNLFGLMGLLQLWGPLFKSHLFFIFTYFMFHRPVMTPCSGRFLRNSTKCTRNTDTWLKWKFYFLKAIGTWKYV